MSNAPFMQLYVGDYLADTRHLTTEQHGAYLLLLMTMWKAGSKLPNDPAKLARIAGVSLRRWHLVWPDLEPFFIVVDDQLTQGRLEKEYQKAVSKSEKRSAAGSIGGKAKALKYNNTDVANAMPLSKHSSEPYIIKKEIDIRAVAKATRTSVDQAFDDFWKAYPKRDGANPKEPARKKFTAAAKSGAEPNEIIEAAKRYRSEVQSKGQEGTPYVAQAVTWLNQHRWGDYAATAPPKPAGEFIPPPGAPTREELLKRYGGHSGERTNDGRSGEGVEGASESLLREGSGDATSGPLRHQAGRNRVGSMQGLGSVLRRTGLDAGGGSALPREECGTDGSPDGMAAVVRFKVHG